MVLVLGIELIFRSVFEIVKGAFTRSFHVLIDSLVKWVVICIT